MARIILLLAVLGLQTESFGQTDGSPATFEVASIRLHQGPLSRIADFSISVSEPNRKFLFPAK
jgi:hypothetical protein